MRYLFFLFFFLYFGIVNASIKLEIIKNFESINNIRFDFKQIVEKKIETGICIISFPKKIFCRYNDIYNKVLVSNGKSVIIKSDKSKQHYRYPIDKTMLNLILDKKFIIKEISKMDKPLNFNKNYMFKIKYKENLIKLYFDKKNLNLMGWTTSDIYQNEVETLISNIDKNIYFNEKIFNFKNYIN